MEYMIINLQSLKGKTNMKFKLKKRGFFSHQKKYMRQNKNFMFDEDTFSKGAQGLAFKTQQSLSVMKSSQTKPQF